jgi:ABC-type Zn uptake system ZnuABC Zn-binding protein ZnuA
VKAPSFPATKTAIVLSAAAVFCISLALVGCGTADDGAGSDGGSLVVLADTSFLADIAQNVAGSRLTVSSILPVDADPHSFEPTPRDATRIAASRAVIINVTGLEPLVDELIASAGGPDLLVIEAAAGVAGASDDPHVWLDPINVIAYAENIAKGLTAIDPGGAVTYRDNAANYAESLRALDAWIVARVETISAENRLLVTNHETLGYFAERYGFKIVGTVFPTVAGSGAPSAQQLTALIGDIKSSGAPAIFLETGSNADLAQQVARETGVKVVTDLYTHSLGKNAATYLDMMRWNVESIVEALR